MGFRNAYFELAHIALQQCDDRERLDDLVALRSEDIDRSANSKKNSHRAVSLTYDIDGELFRRRVDDREQRAVGLWEAVQRGS